MVGKQHGAMPDPETAEDLAGFIGLLGELRVWAGMPPYRTLAKRVGPLMRPPSALSASTVVDVFKAGRRRLDLDLLVAVVRALGADEPDVDRWRQAYLRIQRNAKADGPVRVLRQLPADLSTFTGRERELGEVLAQATAPAGGRSLSTVVISAIEGMAGVGKTQLAVHAAHRLVRAGHFTDAQLYVNLRGFDPEQPSADPAAVLDSFLRQLGVPGQQIPESTDERAAMFRDRLDGRHALVLLDNAADLDQVRHLIPSSPTCLVIVTSRRNFAGLQGSSQLLLETFSMSEAVDLLAAIAGGHRIFAEPEAARRVAELCGRLPLAVALSGARLRSRPAWSVAELAKRLEQDGIDAVSAGEHPLRAVFDLSYRGLPASTRRLFALLGLYPGEDFTCEAAAALAGVDRTQARRTLEILQDEHVLQQKAPGRYSLHDLLRDYAAGRAEAEMAEGERRAAIRTALAWHVAVVTLTTLAISPDRVMPPIDPDVAHISAPQAFNAAEAVLWYGRERANLMQAVEAAGRLGFGSLAWRLPIAMAYFEELAQNYRELERLMSTALPHARADADPDAETSVVRWLTFALRAQGRAAEAIGPLNRVLEARRAAGDRLSVGRVLGSLAEAHSGIGDPGRALQLVQEAIRTIEETGGPVPSSFLTITSLCLMRLGRLIEALTYQVAFVERARKADDPRAAALGQHNVGDNYLLQGRMEEAAEAFEEAITLAAETGDRYVQADCLNGLAVSLRARGLIEAARARHREAVAVFDDLPEQEAARYLAQLDASSLRYVE